MDAAFRPRVGHARILDLGHGLVELVQEPGGQWIVEHGVGRHIVRSQREERRHGAEADDGRPLRRQRQAGVDEQRGADEVDGQDLPPVRHGGRHAGSMGDGPQRAELCGPGHEAADAVADP